MADRAETPGILPEGIVAQTNAVMANLKVVLAGLGLGFEHVVMSRVYLTRFREDYVEMHESYRSYFEPGATIRVGVTGPMRHPFLGRAPPPNIGGGYWKRATCRVAEVSRFENKTGRGLSLSTLATANSDSQVVQDSRMEHAGLSPAAARLRRPRFKPPKLVVR